VGAAVREPERLQAPERGRGGRSGSRPRNDDAELGAEADGEEQAPGPRREVVVGAAAAQGGEVEVRRGGREERERGSGVHGRGRARARQEERGIFASALLESRFFAFVRQTLCATQTAECRSYFAFYCWTQSYEHALCVSLTLMTINMYYISNDDLYNKIKFNSL